MTIHFQDPRGAAWLRYSNRADITVPMCEQKPHPVWFLCPVFVSAREAILCLVNIAVETGERPKMGSEEEHWLL